MKPNIIVTLLSILIFFASCLDDVPEDFDNPDSDWNPNFSMALGHTSLGMNEESGFDTLLLLINSNTGYPYWVEEIDVPMEYTMPFDMEELGEFSEEIISVMFRINTYNGFPADAKAQVYFLDINNQIVDSLFNNEPLTIEPGKVVGDGELVEKKHQQSDIVFNQDKIDDLITVRNILIQGGIKNLSLDSTLIDYYPLYTLDIQMGLQVELNLSISGQLTQNNDQ